MKVLEYRMLSVEDVADTEYRAWSRAYEYPLVLRTLTDARIGRNSLIHNTACGNEPIHLRFAKELTRRWPNTLHSDIFPDIPGLRYVRHNLTIEQPAGRGLFDAVLCVSVVEHLPKAKHLVALNNLLQQCEPGGHLILTFDWPRVSNQEVERWCGAKMKDVRQRLNGGNSVWPDKRYRHLNVILLHIQRV